MGVIEKHEFQQSFKNLNYDKKIDHSCMPKNKIAMIYLCDMDDKTFGMCVKTSSTLHCHHLNALSVHCISCHFGFNILCTFLSYYNVFFLFVQNLFETHSILVCVTNTASFCLHRFMMQSNQSSFVCVVSDEIMHQH